MSDTKFTPGPWRSVRSDPSKGADVWWLIAGEGNYETEIGSLSGGFPHDKRAANAHLIAAAPDLYAALSDLLEYMGDEKHTDPFAPSEYNDLAANARRALSRARGEE